MRVMDRDDGAAALRRKIRSARADHLAAHGHYPDTLVLTPAEFAMIWPDVDHRIGESRYGEMLVVVSEEG